MKKYYYDCPIQALYMQKEFGVEFVMKDFDGDYSDFNYWVTYADDIKELREVFESFCSEILVTDESNHIFEPKENDLVFSQEYSQFQKIQPNTHRDIIKFLRITDIVMRNEKHFFMPKVIEE